MGIAVVATLSLAACTYNFRVQAERRGDAYVLTAPETAGRFAPHPCLNRLTILSGEEIVWEIRDDSKGWPSEGGTCERSDFPIVYGVAPAGYRQTVAPRPLQPGAEYSITGSGVSGYHGRFAIRGDLTVDNLRGR